MGCLVKENGREGVLIKGSLLCLVCAVLPQHRPLWPSEVLSCEVRDLRFRVARDYSTLTHGHPTLNLCCLSLLRNLSGQSFVQEIRTGTS